MDAKADMTLVDQNRISVRDTILESVGANGVRYTPEYYLIQREPKESICAISLIELKTNIEVAMKAGNNVLLFPGSYDLVHAGHFGYVLQAIQTFTKNDPDGVNIEELPLVSSIDNMHLVMLADDSPLIASRKWNAPESRPVENLRARQETLASLPIDFAGFIPSPNNPCLKDKNEDIFNNEIQIRIIDRFAALGNFGDITIDDFIKQVSTNFSELSRLLGSYDHPNREKFKQADLQKNIERLTTMWLIYVYSYLTLDLDYTNGGQLVRIVSAKEDYNHEVQRLMEACGIPTFAFVDQDFVRTSTILSASGNKATRPLSEKYNGDPYKITNAQYDPC